MLEDKWQREAERAIAAHPIIQGNDSPPSIGFFKLYTGNKVYTVTDWLEEDLYFLYDDYDEEGLEEKIPLEKRFVFAQRLFNQLMRLHKSNLLHGDLKLQNVMYKEGDYRLIDLDGVSPPEAAHEAIAYTPMCLDEQTFNQHLEKRFSSSKLTFTDDVYALGLIFLKLFPKFGNVQETLITNHNSKKTHRNVPTFYSKDNGLSPQEKDLKTLLQQMLGPRAERPNLRILEEISTNEDISINFVPKVLFSERLKIAQEVINQAKQKNPNVEDKNVQATYQGKKYPLQPYALGTTLLKMFPEFGSDCKLSVGDPPAELGEQAKNLKRCLGELLEQNPEKLTVSGKTAVWPELQMNEETKGEPQSLLLEPSAPNSSM